MRILDRHHSHKTLEAINGAHAHGITLPPHISHKMWLRQSWATVTTEQPLRCWWCDEDYTNITEHWLRHCPAMSQNTLLLPSENERHNISSIGTSCQNNPDQSWRLCADITTKFDQIYVWLKYNPMYLNVENKINTWRFNRWKTHRKCEKIQVFMYVIGWELNFEIPYKNANHFKKSKCIIINISFYFCIPLELWTVCILRIHVTSPILGERISVIIQIQQRKQWLSVELNRWRSERIHCYF